MALNVVCVHLVQYLRIKWASFIVSCFIHDTIFNLNASYSVYWGIIPLLSVKTTFICSQLPTFGLIKDCNGNRLLCHLSSSLLLSKVNGGDVVLVSRKVEPTKSVAHRPVILNCCHPRTYILLLFCLKIDSDSTCLVQYLQNEFDILYYRKHVAWHDVC